MKNNFFNKSTIIKLLIILDALVLIVLVLSILRPKVVTVMDQTYNSSGELISKEINNKNVEVVFESKNSGLSKIKFLMTTFGKKIKSGSIKYTLMDNETGNVVDEKTISANKIKDNKYVSLKFDIQKSSKNRLYKLWILVDCKEPISMFACDGTNINGPITLANTSVDAEHTNNPVYKTYVTNTTYPYSWELCLIFVIVIAIMGVCPLNYSRDDIKKLNLKEKIDE